MSNKRTGRMSPKNAAAVVARSGGMCERCLVAPATEIHHRRYLSRGGMHNVANLLHLCNPNGGGNAGDGCHGEAHTGIGVEVGTAISRYNPLHESEIEFWDLLGRVWRIDDEGGKEEVREGPV